jgi:hypothetical protein
MPMTVNQGEHWKTHVLSWFVATSMFTACHHHDSSPVGIFHADRRYVWFGYRHPEPMIDLNKSNPTKSMCVV